MPKDLVVQDNTLINASYSLSLTEQRIILAAIAKAQKSGLEISHSEYLTIHALDFAETFNLDKKTVYRDLKKACDTLFRREFSFKDGKGVVRSHWLQSSKYQEDSGQIKILFAMELIPFISQLKKRFTSYFLADVANMTSVYAIRLYELIIAWRTTHKTPVFDLSDFRNKLGVKPDEYPDMHNFKKRVLNIAIEQINTLSNIKIELVQHRKGRKIIGFSFTFTEVAPERDPKTIDWVDEDKKPKREKMTINDIVMRHPTETIGKREPEIYKMYSSIYHII